MTLRHMQIFAAVYKCQSITRAAEELNLAQPSVSLAIREIEEHYDVKLFDRLNRRIYPTQAGTKLYGYAIGIISMFDEMEKEISSRKDQEIRIGTSITIGNYILPGLIGLFSKSMPEVTVKSVIRNSADIEKAVMENEVDIGLIENETSVPNLISQPFMDDRLCVIAPVWHELTFSKRIEPSDLENYNFLMREKGSAGRDIIDSFFAIKGVKVKIVLESVSTQAIVRGVESGMGLSVLPYRLVENSIEEHRVEEINVVGLNLKRKFNIICHKNKYINAPIKEFIRLCSQEEE